jgi:predicted DNA-binding protein with PD1-like motif
MQHKLITDAPERSFALVFETGDEVVSTLERFAAEQCLTASRFTAIGAFMSVKLGYFDWQSKVYEKTAIEEQLEVLSLVGDIALADGKPKLHAHVVLGRRDTTTRGGHLLEARVRPTLEVLLTDAPRHLRRRFDAASGLALIEPGA